jgi:hypothetical protein
MEWEATDYDPEEEFDWYNANGIYDEEAQWEIKFLRNGISNTKRSADTIRILNEPLGRMRYAEELIILKTGAVANGR